LYKFEKVSVSNSQQPVLLIVAVHSGPDLHQNQWYFSAQVRKHHLNVYEMGYMIFRGITTFHTRYSSLLLYCHHNC